jgi:hypothetical protein
LEQEYQREIHLTFLICDYPRSLDFRNLPDSVRTVAAERLEQWIPTSRILVKRENNLQAINALIRALKENRHGDWEKQLAIFKKYTSILDKQRNESMSGAIPELWELMYGKNSSS